MEVHICNNCNYIENCKEKWNNSFLYCMCSDIRTRDKRNQEFLSESMIINTKDILES